MCIRDRSGSFSRAAETLNLANASVTASVRNLERHLNVVLISRDSRRLRLTAEGEMLLPRARELLQSLACLEDDVRTQVNALSGGLHIEVPISLGQTLLTPALPAFAKLFPGITTTVIFTNQPHNLIERGLDVAVRLGHVEDPELVARPLFEARYVICGEPAVVESLPEDPAQLDMRLCISMLPGESRVPMAWELTRGDQKIVLQPNGPLHFNNSDSGMVVAKHGMGLVSALDIYARPHLEAGTLVRAYPEWEMPSRTCYLVTTRDRANSAKVRAFTQFLLEVLNPARRPSSHDPVPVRPVRPRVTGSPRP